MVARRASAAKAHFGHKPSAATDRSWAPHSCHLMPHDRATKQDLIRGLIAAGRARELRDLLRGLSPFCERSPRGPVELAPVAETKLVAAARGHLDFIVQFGAERSHVITGEGAHYFSSPEKFEEWLRIGAPGVSLSEVIALSQN